MNIFKEIAGRIWATWGLVSFIVTFLMVLPISLIAYLIPEPRGTAYLIYVSRIWMRIWMFLIGCPIKISGTENFKKGKSYIVTCNHNSLLDIPLSSPFIPGANKTIAKVSFAKIPLFGLYYAKGSVLVDRKSERSRKESFDKMKQVLKMGMHMCIYPEGTRNRTKEPLKPFYNGAFKLAHETKTEVIPAIISGTKEAVPLNKTFFFLPRRLEIRFLPPVSPEGLTAVELKEKVYQTMYQFILDEKRKPD
ncbi:lysophospholipid acyltransferase family protein [Niabella insulamsoli]|uniref:lysophospholipid acyltransferase family protein n=1 Tax=Niabella insulamsoli TaxID=3144874 RepID=UPI0031FC1E79